MESYQNSFSVAHGALQATELLVLAGVFWVIGWGLYHAYLHPLSRCPGPKLWAAYRIPYVYWNIRGQLPFKVLELHRKYGPVVRIAPNEVAFTEPEAWNDIYGLLPGRVQNQKDPMAYPPLQPGHEDGIIHANDAKHAKIRKLYGTAFTPKALEEQSGMLMKYADLLITQLKAAIAKNAVQDMSAWYNFTTFDLTGDFAFGEAFHCLDKGGEFHFFLETVFEGVAAGLQMQQLEYYKVLSLMKPLIPKSAVKPKEDMDQYTKELVDRRMEQGVDEKRVDVFSYLMQNKTEDDELSRNSLYENAITLVVAGSENQDKLEKVQREVRNAFESNEEIDTKSVNDLPYMLAVLSEALRIYPPTGFGFPRKISNEAGQSINGHWLPHKARASIFHHAAYRFESNFVRPEEFIPERWLPDAPPEFKNDRRDVVQPFMVGPRGCIGKNLAIAEMRLILAKMLFNFDFELADPNDDWYSSLRAFMVWDKGSLKIRLKPVER